MRRGELFWGTLLVVLGVLFFLQAAGYITGSVWGWFWPLLIIAVGVWVLLGGFLYRSRYETAEKFSVPLQEAREANLSIEHGAGRIDLRAGANAGDFLTGVAAAGMDKKVHMNDGKLDVEIDAGPSFVPFLGPESGTWEFRVTPDVPVSLKIEAGASRLDLDLTDLRVTYFRYNGGASNLNVTLPARVENTLVEIEAGAASINLHVPQGVALRMHRKGVGSVNVDTQRFPMRDSGLYQSADYDAAQYKTDVTIDGGATSLTVN